MRIVHFSVLTIFRKIILLIIICIIPLCHQVEEFAHINGWEAYPDEENTTDKSSSKTSSRVSTPIGEVDSKKTEAEVKTEAKEAKTEKKEDEAAESKPAAMEVDKDEPGMKSNYFKPPLLTDYQTFLLNFTATFTPLPFAFHYF